MIEKLKNLSDKIENLLQITPGTSELTILFYEYSEMIEKSLMPKTIVLRAIIRHDNPVITSAVELISEQDTITKVREALSPDFHKEFDKHMELCEKFENQIRIISTSNLPLVPGINIRIGNDIMKIDFVGYETDTKENVIAKFYLSKIDPISIPPDDEQLKTLEEIRK